MTRHFSSQLFDEWNGEDVDVDGFDGDHVNASSHEISFARVDLIFAVNDVGKGYFSSFGFVFGIRTVRKAV